MARIQPRNSGNGTTEEVVEEVIADGTQSKPEESVNDKTIAQQKQQQELQDLAKTLQQQAAVASQQAGAAIASGVDQYALLVVQGTETFKGAINKFMYNVPQTLPINPLSFEIALKQRIAELMSAKLATNKVIVDVPKPFKLTQNNGVAISFAAGVQEVEEWVANHWWAKIQGMKIFKKEGVETTPDARVG